MPYTDIAEFTAEQWAWLKERTREFEAGYVPTRSLTEGLQAGWAWAAVAVNTRPR